MPAKRCARSQLDLDEGADIVMVKPAMCYLDVVSRRGADFAGTRGRLSGVGGSTR